MPEYIMWMPKRESLPDVDAGRVAVLGRAEVYSIVVQAKPSVEACATKPTHGGKDGFYQINEREIRIG